MDILFNTIRNEIGECLEKAYNKISIGSATIMLNFRNIYEITEFSVKVVKLSFVVF